MDYNVQTVLGPRTASVGKEDALVQLQTHPDYPKGAIVANFDEINGQWQATLRVPKAASTHEAAPPPPGLPSPDGPPTPPAPSDGPPKPEGDSEDGPPSDEAEKPSEEKPGEEEGPPKPGEEEGKPNVEHQLVELTGLLHQIADALGVGPAAGPPHPGAGPEVGGPPALPAGPGHQGPGRPPQGPGGQSAMMRSRPLKPGEAPNSPGVTPVGAPAFASVADDHPWKPMLGKVATFNVNSEVEDDEAREGMIARAAAELNDLAGNVWDAEKKDWVPGPNATGYRVAQVKEGRSEDGKRVIKALITAR